MANKKTLTPTSLPASLTLPEERKAEKALLFGLLASRKSLPEIAFRIRPEMFTHPDIALAIEAYLSLHGKGEGTDILSVEKEIRRLSPERAGQLPDLFELARQDGYMEVGGEFVRQHCQYIREAFVARRLILRCHELAHKAAADDRDTQKLISELGTVADELGEQLSLTHEIPDMPTATAEAMARVREIRKRVARGGTAGIHTGLGGLDRLMGGLRTGSLHVFAARPGMGKTAFALFMAVNAAKQGVPVCVYSLEMSREQLIFRMLGQIADVEPSKITKGTATEEEMRALEEASRQLKELPICINQRSDIQIDEIRCDILEMSREQLIFRMLGQIADVEPSKITKGTATEEEMRALEEASRQLKELPICINQRSDIQIDEIRCDISLRRRQGKCSLAIIDYLQLVNRDDKGQTPNEAISNITRKAKITAMDEEIPIVLLCQLNRNCETRGTYSFKHQLSDLRDSGSIEQDADTVAFISRLSVVNIHEDPDTHLPTRGRGTILLAKNRQGELGHVRFMHNEGVTSFWDDTQPACVRKARAAEPKPKGKGLFEC